MEISLPYRLNHSKQSAEFPEESPEIANSS